MNYLDSSIIVPALLARHPNHQDCFHLVNAHAVTSCHALAESFSTLNGQYKVANFKVTEMIERFAEVAQLETILPTDYLAVIKEARTRGIQGGLIYDAIHAAVARRLGVEKVFTYNLSDFKHVAPDLNVVSP